MTVPADDGARTVIADQRVMDAWRRGPRWFHVIAAMIDDSRVEERQLSVAAELSDCLRVHAPGQPHVTLWASGTSDPPVVPEGLTLDLVVGSPDTFESAAYLAVEGHLIAPVRAELAAGRPDEKRAEDYVPHVTVGLYTAVTALDGVRRRLAAMGPLPALAVTASVRTMAVDRRSADGRLVPTDPRPTR